MKKSRMFTFGLGALGNNIIYAFISTYLLYFYIESFGIPVSSTVGILLFPRIWDAINDPVMGIIVDNTKTRFGKFRPYLIVVPFIMAITTVLCFSAPNLSPDLKIVYAYITYTLWGMSFTAMDIPYWSLSAVLSQDASERSDITMIARTFASIGFLVVNLLTLPLVELLGSWAAVAVLFGIACVSLTLITFFFSEEKVKHNTKEKMTFKKVLILIKANRELRLLLASMLMIETVNVFKFTFTLFYLEYTMKIKELIPLMLGLYLICTVIGSIISPSLSRKIGKKQVTILGALVVSFTGICMFLTGYSNITMVFVWNSFQAIGYGAMMIAQTTMIMDCVEYGQYLTGIRAEGMVFSTNIFKTKVASAIGGGIGALGLSMIGFVSHTNQTVTTMNGMHNLFTIIPGMLSLLSIIPILFYTLTEEKYDEIVLSLEKAS